MADPGVDAVLAHCATARDRWACPKPACAALPHGGAPLPLQPKVHTDFMAFRPAALAPSAFAAPPRRDENGSLLSAEADAAEQFASIVARGRAAWLCTSAGAHGVGHCRMDAVEVAHAHSHACLAEPQWTPPPSACRVRAVGPRTRVSGT